MSEEQQEKLKMCGGCKNHQGRTCDKHPGVYLATAAACDDFDPKQAQRTPLVGGPVQGPDHA